MSVNLYQDRFLNHKSIEELGTGSENADTDQIIVWDPVTASFHRQTYAELRTQLTKNFALEASLGNEAGYATVNKFGEAPDCDSSGNTDIWDGADGATSTKVWVPPTQARIHDITSTAAADTNSAGANARTLRVWGLVDWDTAESFEDINLNGVANVATANAYVIIHRMEVLTAGANGVNAGILTATAQTDGTVTSCILAGINQTLMCIYGVPSTQKLRITGAHCNILGGSGSTRRAEGVIAKMRDPATNAANNTLWTVKHNFHLADESDPFDRPFGVPKKFDGPCIVKIQAQNPSANNLRINGSFDAYLVTT